MVAAVLLALEGLIGLGYAGIAVGQIRMSRAVVGLGVAYLMAAFGLLLLVVARGVFLGRRWSRGPAVVTQLILLPLAWSFKGGATTWVSVVLAVVAIAALVGLLHRVQQPSSLGRRPINRRRQDELVSPPSTW